MSLSIRRDFSFVLAILLFFLFLYAGFKLAVQRHLWNDEIYTQFYSIDRHSYGQIWKGQLVEGNNAPLFYFLQKIVVDSFHFKAPEAWEGRPKITDLRAKIILRLHSVVFMSFVLSFVFYYFSHRFSVIIGLYSLLVSLSFFVVWNYWAEARPYGLWFGLSLLELLWALDIAEERRKGSSAWAVLLIINTLMSLTVVFSMIQIFIVSIFFWINKQDKKNILLCVGLPFLISAYYYLASPKYMFYFDRNPFELIFSIIPLSIWTWMIVYGLILFWSKRKISIADWPGTKIIPLVIFFTVAALVLLGLFFLKNQPDPRSFALTNRYFVFLAPMSIVMTIFFSIDLYGFFKKNKISLVCFLIGMATLFIFTWLSQPDIFLRLVDLYLG